MVESGALEKSAISDIEIGKIYAEQAIEIIKGKTVEEETAIIVPDKDTVVNSTTKEMLELEISDDSDIIYVEDKQD